MGKTTNKNVAEQDVFDHAYQLVSDKIKDIKDWTAIDVMMLAVIGMQVTDEYPALKGAEKKELVIRLAKKVVKEMRMPKDERRQWLLAIDILLPGAINQIVAAANGQLAIGSAAGTGGAAQSGRGCFGCLVRR